MASVNSSHTVFTGMQLELTDRCAVIIMKMIRNRLHPGVVGVPWVINVTTIYLKPQINSRNKRKLNAMKIRSVMV